MRLEVIFSPFLYYAYFLAFFNSSESMRISIKRRHEMQGIFILTPYRKTIPPVFEFFKEKKVKKP